MAGTAGQLLARFGTFAAGLDANAVWARTAEYGPNDAVLALLLPELPLGRWFGFVLPPPLFFVYLLAATLAYIALVELAKAVFYRNIVRARTVRA